MQGRIDKRNDSTDTHVGVLLLAGLLCSMAAMVAGVVLSLLQGRNLPAHVLPLTKVVAALTAGRGPAFVDVGILILFATPFFGVLAALIEFSRQRDRAFVTVSATLLVVLCAGFAVATHS
ncbi:MAG TPA: DUF1634 domain-containing protein [Chloroflexota bacterium]